MTTRTLMEILKTRIAACDGNPTELRFLTELREALFRLLELEDEPPDTEMDGVLPPVPENSWKT